MGAATERGGMAMWRVLEALAELDPGGGTATAVRDATNAGHSNRTKLAQQYVDAALAEAAAAGYATDTAGTWTLD